MSKPVIRLTYDKAGNCPIRLSEAGYIIWPDTPTDEHDFTYYITNTGDKIEGVNIDDIKKSDKDTK